VVNSKRLEDGIILASGEPFEIVQEAGVAATFSYTAAAGVYFVVTSTGGDGIYVHYGTFVTSASGVYGIMYALGLDNDSPRKVVFGDGTVITASAALLDQYGIYLAGVEI